MGQLSLFDEDEAPKRDDLGVLDLVEAAKVLARGAPLVAGLVTDESEKGYLAYHLRKAVVTLEAVVRFLTRNSGG